MNDDRRLSNVHCVPIREEKKNMIMMRCGRGGLGKLNERGRTCSREIDLGFFHRDREMKIMEMEGTEAMIRKMGEGTSTLKSEGFNFLFFNFILYFKIIYKF